MRQLHGWLLGGLLGVFGAVFPAPTRACEPRFELSASELTQLDVQSKKALDAGNYRKAFALINRYADVEFIMDDDTVEVTANTELCIWGAKGPIERRLFQTYAVALLRARPQKMLTALAIIDDLLEKTPKDPYLRTRLAEALVVAARVVPAMPPMEGTGMADLIKQKAAELTMRAKGAQKILERLDKEGLPMDAEGHALLSCLRKKAGDAVGAQAALARCRNIAKRPKEQCRTTDWEDQAGPA